MRSIQHLPFILLCLCSPLLAQAPGPKAPLPEDRAVGGNSIDPTEVRAWLTTLTSEEFGGRGTGQEGFRKAAHFVRSHFDQLGLEPAGDKGDYLQTVPWKRNAPHMQRTRIEIRSGGKALVTISAADGLRGSISQNSEQSGGLVLVRYEDIDSIEEVDLEGKLVLIHARDGVIEGEGRRAQFQARTELSRAGQAIRKAGGQLLAIIADDYYQSVGPIAPRTSPGGASGGRVSRGRGMRPQQLLINAESLEKILRAANLSDDALAKAKGPVISLGGLNAHCKVEIETTDAPAFNVLGVLRGSDPKLRDEFVAVGCHLDHLGQRSKVMYPGADDDGSGSVGLMAIAQAFAKNPIRPKRSILFMAFCGEENGLRGSSFLSENSPVPLEQIVAELQIDMIGRNEEHDGEKAADNINSVHLIGSEKLSRDLHEVCLRLNEQRAGLDLEYDEEDVFYRSDHWNFAKEGVPIVFLFTGFHPDYHRPTDTIDKINFPKLCRIATYVYDMAFELANQDQRPMVDADLWAQLKRKGREEPAAPLRKKQ